MVVLALHKGHANSAAILKIHAGGGTLLTGSNWWFQTMPKMNLNVGNILRVITQKMQGRNIMSGLI